MTDKDFKQLIDHEFAQLEWTEQQRLHTLQLMTKEETPVMKRKFSLALIAVLALLAMSVTALAAGINISTIQDFINANANWSLSVNSGAVVHPVHQRHTSQLMDVSIDQVYLTDEQLLFTLHLVPWEENTLLFSCGSNSTMLNGQEVRYYDLWDSDLNLLQMGPMEIDDLNTRNPVAEMALPILTQEPDGSYTLLCATSDDDTIRYFRSSGSQLMLRFYIDDCRSRDREWNVVFFDLPAIEKQEHEID